MTQANVSATFNQKKIIITVDVEALTGRAEKDHVDRLIWGKYPNIEEHGIGKMMSIADKYGVKISFFLDYAERDVYGEYLLDVGKEILRRGHDLQLHLHPSMFTKSFYSSKGITLNGDLRTCPKQNCKVFLDYIIESHANVASKKPVAYRSDSYFHSIPLLEAVAEAGIVISSNFLPCYPDRGVIKLGSQKYFKWPCGVFELPVSCIENFPNSPYALYAPDHIAAAPNYVAERCLPYNFNDYTLLNGNDGAYIERHKSYLNKFFATHGEDAVAVMVMHSWSFFRRAENGYQNILDKDAAHKFDLLLEVLSPNMQFLTLDNFAENLPSAPELAELTFRGISVIPAGINSEKLADIACDATCPICGTSVKLFTDFNNGSKRQCPECQSLERQRAFAALYQADAFCEKSRLKGAKILHFSPSPAETRLLSSIPDVKITTADIRPGMNIDIVIDISNMSSIPSNSFDVVFLSYVISLTQPEKLIFIIREISRVLKPGGLLLCTDNINNRDRSVSNLNFDSAISHYGKENYDKFGIGQFFYFSASDFESFFTDHFTTQLLSSADTPTGAVTYWLKAEKKVPVQQELQAINFNMYAMKNLPAGFGDKELLDKQYNENADRVEKIAALLRTKKDIRDNYEAFCELNEIMREPERVFPHYDPQLRVKDSKELLEKIVSEFGKFDSYLDIGCGMGYAPRAAFEMGVTSYGIDIVSSPAWHEYATNTDGKLTFTCGDLASTTFPLKFDLITSYNAFEHFDSPQYILDCIADNLSDNGIFYAKTSPIFYCKDGHHLYRQISIPWFQNIFSARVIRRFLGMQDDGPLYSGLNKWSAFDFVDLFALQQRLELIKKSYMWDTSKYWFANLFHSYLPFSPQDLFFYGFTVAWRKKV